MTKIEELLNGYDHQPGYDDIVKLMKKYAEIYAKKCLEIAAEECQIDMEIPVIDGCSSYTDYYYVPDKNSIKNIILPEHE